MLCCTHCFVDPEIKAIIEDAKIIGDCDYCGSKDVYVYQLDNDSLLADTFEGILDIYTEVVNLPEAFPKIHADLLSNILYEQWRIFNASPDIIYRLITTICHDKYEEKPELFDAPVGILQTMIRTS